MGFLAGRSFQADVFTPRYRGAARAHAHERNLSAWIAALFAGEKVNLSEVPTGPAHRIASTATLRRRIVDGADVVPRDPRDAGAHARARACKFAAALRIGATGRPLRNVVNIADRRIRSRAAEWCATRSPGPRAANAARPRCEHSFPMSIPRTLSPRAHGSRSGDDAVHRHLEDVHHRGNAAQRAFRARMAHARSRRTHAIVAAFHCCHRQCRRSARIRCRREATFCRSGIGWEAAISVWSAAGLADRGALRLGHLRRIAGRRRQRRRAFPRPHRSSTMFRCCWGWSISGTRARLGHPQRVIVPYAHALPRCFRYICSSSRSRATASRSRATARRSYPAPTPGGVVGRSGQRQPARLLSMAAPRGRSSVPVEFVVPLRAAHPLGEQQDAAHRQCARAIARR